MSKILIIFSIIIVTTHGSSNSETDKCGQVDLLVRSATQSLEELNLEVIAEHEFIDLLFSINILCNGLVYHNFTILIQLWFLEGTYLFVEQN